MQSLLTICPARQVCFFAFVLFPKVKIELDFHETGQQHFQEAKNLKIAKELEVEQRLMTNRIWFAFFSPFQVCKNFLNKHYAGYL